MPTCDSTFSLSLLFTGETCVGDFQVLGGPRTRIPPSGDEETSVAGAHGAMGFVITSS